MWYEQWESYRMYYTTYHPTITNQYVPLVVTATQPNNKESAMSTITTNTAAIAATIELPGRREKDYLISRLDIISNAHRNDLKEHFNLNAQDPKTPMEMMKMLKAGHFELDEKRLERVKASFYTEDEIYYGDPLHYLIFRDPKKKRDKEGYDAAEKKMYEAKQKAKDAIIVKSPEDGLLAMQAYEAATFH